jgi:hypothetical protein
LSLTPTPPPSGHPLSLFTKWTDGMIISFHSLFLFLD